jgi:sporulation protein YlmC with PRC-barrel domain
LVAGVLLIRNVRRTASLQAVQRHLDERRTAMGTAYEHDVVSSDDVEGTNVYNTAGDKLGSIDDLMIDKVSGKVRFAVMEFGGFLGMNTDRYPIPWDLLKYDLDKEGYVVPLDEDRLSKAPRYAHNDAPTYTREYGSQVDRFYTPYL